MCLAPGASSAFRRSLFRHISNLASIGLPRYRGIWSWATLIWETVKAPGIHLTRPRKAPSLEATGRAPGEERYSTKLVRKGTGKSRSDLFTTQHHPRLSAHLDKMTNLTAPTIPLSSPQSPSLSDHVYQTLAQTSAPTGRVPSPPPIWVPPPTIHGATEPVVVSLKDPALSWAVASLAGLTEDEYLFITDNNKPQQGDPNPPQWSYADRHKAHPILDYLSLGPASVVRKPGFLEDAGITMVLAVRDARFPTSFQGALDTAERSGVVAKSVLVDHTEPGFGLLRVHGEFVRHINRHLLALAESSPWPAHRGRVLVVCETGSDRSVLMVGSYIMAMYGLGVVDVVPFMLMQRFCATVTDPYRRALQTLEDLLRARLDVTIQRGASAARDAAMDAAMDALDSGGKKRAADDDDDDNGGPEVRPGAAPYKDCYFGEDLMMEPGMIHYDGPQRPIDWPACIYHERAKDI